MNRWDFIRFVYETEKMLALAGVAGPEGPSLSSSFNYGGDSDSIDPGPDVQKALAKQAAKTAGGGGGGGGGKKGDWKEANPDTNCLDANGKPIQSKECDKTLAGGGYLMDPCWMLNTYAGMKSFTEDNLQKVITGDRPLSRGSNSLVRVESGFGWYGSGLWPDLYQGYYVALVNGTTGAESCKTYGFSSRNCRHPNAAFPLGAPVCTGKDIGGAAGVAAVETMWNRFKVCMRTQYPDCGGGT